MIKCQCYQTWHFKIQHHHTELKNQSVNSNGVCPHSFAQCIQLDIRHGILLFFNLADNVFGELIGKINTIYNFYANDITQFKFSLLKSVLPVFFFF